MSREYREFAVTTPVATSVASPQRTVLEMPPRAITSVRVRIPPGPRGEMGFALANAGTAVIPAEPGTWLITDDETLLFTPTDATTSGTWDLLSYNTGTYPHTVYLTFGCTLPGEAAEPVTPGAIASGTIGGAVVTTPGPVTSTVSTPPLPAPTAPTLPAPTLPTSTPAPTLPAPATASTATVPTTVPTATVPTLSTLPTATALPVTVFPPPTPTVTSTPATTPAPVTSPVVKTSTPRPITQTPVVVETFGPPPHVTHPTPTPVTEKPVIVETFGPPPHVTHPTPTPPEKKKQKATPPKPIQRRGGRASGAS